MDEDAIWELLTGRRAKPLRIAWLYPGHMRAIGAQTAEVWLSPYTALKIEFHHRREAWELYRLLPHIITFGECRQLAKNKIVFLWSRLEDTSRPCRAIIKSAAGGKEVYLTAAYRIQLSKWNKCLRKA